MSSAGPEDAFVRLSRRLLYAGLAGSSILAPRFGELTVGDVLLAASVVALAVSMARAPRPAPFQRVRWAAFHVTLVGGLVALLGTGFVPAAASVLLRVLFVAFVLPWVVHEVLVDRRSFGRAVYALALGAATTGYGTVLQLVLGPDIIPQAEVTNAGRYSGFTGHVSDTGGITCLALIAGVVLFLHSSRRVEVAMSLVVLLGGGVGLILSGSVSGMLTAGAVATAALVLLRTTRRRGLALLLGAAGAVGAVVVLPTSGTVGLDPVQRFMQTVGLAAGNDPSTNTLSSRWSTITVGWQRFLDAPFRGHGLDSVSSEVVDELPAHDLWVGALYQGGAVFTLGITLVIVTSCYLGWRTFRDGAAAYAAAFVAWGAGCSG